ncbi:ribonuclease HIII [Bacillus sp. IB182487]|uniref:Ribonuclease HIII n=2 Tax=Metabacillus arenae TaxID=2771434 RepID=A0A926S1L7_9BACI|nr:ribonuclease HIII [Metabacillus arenae]
MVDPITLNKMKQHYQEYVQPKVPPGAVFTAKKNGSTITAYKSGKVLFQGNASLAEAAIWGTLEQKQKTTIKKHSKPATIFSPPKNISTLSIIGSDEVGTGDYFGPITVTAAYVRREQFELLKELGVKDSKNLKDPQIISIAKDLIHTIPYSLLVLHNEKYNTLQQSGMSQGKMKALLHNQAIGHLKEKIGPEEPEAVLIDQFVDPAIYFKHLYGKSYTKENTYFSTKAEGIHLAVAAASIIARYSFVKEFEKLSEKAGILLPKGAGSQVDIAAAKLMKKHGFETLRQFTKLHFANTEKAKKLAKFEL